MTDLEKVVKVCAECGSEYEASTGNLMGVKIEFGGHKCPDCRQRALVELEKKEAEAKASQLRISREKWRKECGIPLRFRDCRFDNFDLTTEGNINKAWAACKDYASKFKPYQPRTSSSLVLYSSHIWGVGKTFLVCSIIHDILDRWEGEPQYCPVRFITEPQLFLRVRATFNNHYSETENDIYKELMRIPLLILDDIGKEEVADSRFVQRVLFAVIDGRYQNMLPIVITTNLDTDALDRHLGGDRGNSASMDRLAEMTGNVFVELKGRSYRDVKNRVQGGLAQ